MKLNATATVTSISASTGTAWNGPVCQTCGKGYLGMHQCSPADLLRKAADLIEQAGRLGGGCATGTVDQTRSCPCRPENGGSGVCGCTLGGPTITY